MRNFKSLVVGIAFASAAALAAAAPASAGSAGPSSFSPDGVNWIPVPGHSGGQNQVLSYLNGGNFSPDGVSNLQDQGRQFIAMFSPDGVNQIEVVDGPRIVRNQVLAYLNGGNFSPDGVSNLQDQGQVRNGLSDLAYLYMEISDAAYVG